VLEGIRLEDPSGEVGEIFDKIKKKHVNVVVERSATTAESSQEVSELRKELDFLRSLQKGIFLFYNKLRIYFSPNLLL